VQENGFHFKNVIKMIPDTGWCISEWTICYFHKIPGLSPYTGDNSWIASTVRRGI